MDDNMEECMQWVKNPCAADWMGQAMETARQFRGARMELHRANAEIEKLNKELAITKKAFRFCLMEDRLGPLVEMMSAGQCGCLDEIMKNANGRTS